jgi:hypothetical protein
LYAILRHFLCKPFLLQPIRLGREFQTSTNPQGIYNFTNHMSCKIWFVNLQQPINKWKDGFKSCSNGVQWSSKCYVQKD